MASLFFLRECMEDAARRMDDKSLSSEERRAARSMFWHCEKRVGTMERGGLTEEPDGASSSVTPDGWPLVGYSEIGYGPCRKGKKPEPTPDERRREYLDRKAGVQIKAREAL